MPPTKDGRYFANAQVARAHDRAGAMPRPKPMQKRESETPGGGHDADHGGIAKVETIVHHQDGHKERAEHSSPEEASSHLQALSGGDPDGQQDGQQDGQGEVDCPECHGEDPHCPMCDGTGKVPAGEESDDTEEHY
jgi:hypothetical protein